MRSIEIYQVRNLRLAKEQFLVKYSMGTWHLPIHIFVLPITMFHERSRSSKDIFLSTLGRPSGKINK